VTVIDVAYSTGISTKSNINITAASTTTEYTPGITSEQATLEKPRCPLVMESHGI